MVLSRKSRSTLDASSCCHPLPPDGINHDHEGTSKHCTDSRARAACRVAPRWCVSVQPSRWCTSRAATGGVDAPFGDWPRMRLGTALRSPSPPKTKGRVAVACDMRSHVSRDPEDGARDSPQILEPAHHHPQQVFAWADAQWSRSSHADWTSCGMWSSKTWCSVVVLEGLQRRLGAPMEWGHPLQSIACLWTRAACVPTVQTDVGVEEQGILQQTIHLLHSFWSGQDADVVQIREYHFILPKVSRRRQVRHAGRGTRGVASTRPLARLLFLDQWRAHSPPHIHTKIWRVDR